LNFLEVQSHESMSSHPSPTPDRAPQQGISLEELADAFAQVMGQAPRTQKPQPDEDSVDAAADEEQDAEEIAEDRQRQGDLASETIASESRMQGVTLQALKTSKADDSAAEDSCPLSPKTIFESMLFVGNRENRPLTAARAAELMRDVSPEEIPQLVEELNSRYESSNCPYTIIGEGDGYRLTLRKEFHPLRNVFYGRVREARLSQAAIDVLALVAYKQPLSGEQIHKLRGKPSSHILAQLVRRGLLRIERPAEKPRTPRYSTTGRFMQLFNLDSLDDLPRSEDPG
jgi:segregation and condensation protein B